jgi:hypothetical protein
MLDSRTFSAKEALSLLGKKVRASLRRSELPAGAAGRVIRVRRGGRCASGFSVGIQWQGREGTEELTKAEFECYVALEPVNDSTET